MSRRQPDQAEPARGDSPRLVVVLMALALTAFAESTASAPWSIHATGERVDEMASRSTAVCVVRVVGSALRHAADGRDTLVRSCEVLDTWKAPEASPLPSRLVICQEPRKGRAELERGEVYVVFIERMTGTDCILTHDRYGALRLPGLRTDPDGKQETVRARLVAQYRLGLEEGDAGSVVLSLDGLGKLGELPDRPKLVELSKHARPEIARCAQIWLVRGKDRATVKRAVRMLINGRERDRWDPVSTLLLRSAINGVADCVEVADANALAVAQDPEDRLLGLRILMSVGDETSVAALVRGLDESDTHAQYAAVRSMARIAGEGFGTFSAFQNDPEPVISKWRRWAQAR